MKTHAGRKLSRPTGARRALLRNLVVSLLKHEQIRTTLAKAREAARFAETILSFAKKKDLAAYRRVGSLIHDQEVRKKIHEVLAPRYQARPGGCTRVLRLGARSGDGAEMALVRLVR